MSDLDLDALDANYRAVVELRSAGKGYWNDVDAAIRVFDAIPALIAAARERDELREELAEANERIEEYRNQRRDMFDKLVALGAALDTAEKALRPISDCVYNDNGDMTVDMRSIPNDERIAAYFSLREIAAIRTTRLTP